MARLRFHRTYVVAQIINMRQARLGDSSDAGVSTVHHREQFPAKRRDGNAMQNSVKFLWND